MARADRGGSIVSASTHLRHREFRLRYARDERRAVYRAGGMSDRELYDEVNFLIAQCSPEQHETKERLLTIAADLDLDMPDADAHRRFPGPATPSERLERA
jgi:hypothetical protein